MGDVKRKKVPVIVVFHLEYEVPDDWDEEQIAFHLEDDK